MFNVRIPCFEFLHSFSFCGEVDVLLQGNSVVQHCVFFSPPGGIQRVSVRFTGVPSLNYRWVASVLLLTCLFRHLFRLEVLSLSFRRSVLGSTTAVLLDNTSRD